MRGPSGRPGEQTAKISGLYIDEKPGEEKTMTGKVRDGVSKAERSQGYRVSLEASMLAGMLTGTRVRHSSGVSFGPDT